MTGRDFDSHPYSEDEQRVANFLYECAFGGGDDPIGFLITSYAFLIQERKRFREAIAFARSVIKSGEGWSQQCEEKLDLERKG